MANKLTSSNKSYSRFLNIDDLGFDVGYQKIKGNDRATSEKEFRGLLKALI